MNPFNPLRNIIPGFLSARTLSRQFVLLLISLWMHGFVYAQQHRQKAPEPRKGTIVNKANKLFQSTTKPNSRILSPNQTLCDFTLTPVNAVSNSLSQIIQSLAGNGITISNIQTNLPASSDIYGSFSCGSAAKLGIESGLILTTGVIGNAKGPNIYFDASVDNNLPGYSPLDALVGGGETGYDASIVSFNIVSNTNKIIFQYVFASEEYNEFVGTEYNDVFGFFIIDPVTKDTQNIAVLPNTSTPVSINTVNKNLNAQYYLDNDSEDSADAVRFANLEYDGLTTVLTATGTVVPGKTYKLILAIEDVADADYDTGVFIKGGSITGGECNMILAAAPTNVTCPGSNDGSINLAITNGKAPFSIKWSNNATTEDLTNLAAGTYTVTVTDASPCQKVLQVTVSSGSSTFIPAVSIAAIPAGAICPGTNVTFTATPTNGGTAPLYQWKRNGNNVGTNTTNNTYQNAALVNGDKITCVMTSTLACANPKTATSNQITMLVTAPLATIIPTGSLSFCLGKSVLLSANTGAGYTYQWKKAGVNIAGAIQATYTATIAGVYTVVVTTAAGGCSTTSAAKTVVVNPLPLATVTAGGPLTFCTGKNVLLKASPGAGYIYQWKKAGVNIAGATLANYTATVSGVYTVLVTNALGCSITSAAITVVVNPLPIATVTPGGPLTFCTGKNVLLKANTGTGYKYQWKKAGVNIANATLANYTATLSGAYTVVVTNAVGCSITSAATTVVVNPLPIATITPGGPLTFCTGKNVLLKASPGAGYIYQWKKAGVNIAGATLVNYTATVSGIYTVLVTNALGCSITSAAITVVVNPLPIATITPGGPLTIPAGGNVVLKANTGTGYTYQWKKDGVNIAGALSNTYTATVAGVYTVIITNSNSCQATSQPVQVLVSPAALITKGAPSYRQEEKDKMNPEPVIKVFPNPLHGDEYLNFEWNISSADKSIQVTVFDISGRMVESRFLNSSGKKLRINGVSGIYMVEIRWGKNERKIFQIIKI